MAVSLSIGASISMVIRIVLLSAKVHAFAVPKLLLLHDGETVWYK